MPVRLAVGLGITVVMFAIAGRRFYWLFRLISAGEPAVPARNKDVPSRVEAEVVEVGGQRKLLQWTVPGLAHFFTFWGFTILLLTILEAYGALFQRDFHIPLIGHAAFIGFVEDFFTCAVIVALLRVRHHPDRAVAEAGGSPLALLRLPYRRGLDGAPLHLRCDGHPAPLPGRPGQHRQLPVRLVGVRVARARQPAPSARHRRQQRHRDGGRSSPTSRSSPASSSSCRTRNTSTSSWRRSTSRPHAGPAPSARSPRPRTSTMEDVGDRGRGLRWSGRSDRGLHLEAAPRLRDLHRVRSVPVSVPGLEHRQASLARSCSSWTSATTSSPRRTA